MMHTALVQHFFFGGFYQSLYCIICIIVISSSIQMKYHDKCNMQIFCVPFHITSLLMPVKSTLFQQLLTIWTVPLPPAKPCPQSALSAFTGLARVAGFDECHQSGWSFPFSFAPPAPGRRESVHWTPVGGKVSVLFFFWLLFFSWRNERSKKKHLGGIFFWKWNFEVGKKPKKPLGAGNQLTGRNPDDLARDLGDAERASQLMDVKVGKLKEALRQGIFGSNFLGERIIYTP